MIVNQMIIKIMVFIFVSFLNCLSVAQEKYSLKQITFLPGEVGFFDKTRTPLPDAVELIDLHLSLEPDAMSRDSSEVGE